MFNTPATSRFNSLPRIMLAAAAILLPATQAHADDDRDVVIHAGGAVEFSIDQGWTVSEVPFGREVRLYLTRGPLPKRIAKLSDGAWLVFHARASKEKLSDRELADLLTARVRDATESIVIIQTPRKVNVAGHAGLRGRFQYTDGNDKTPGVRRGVHLLVPVEGGLFELHLVAADADFAQRVGQLDAILRTLKLRSPKQTRPRPDPHHIAAILGHWKALHSRLQLHDDGRVVIRFDRTGNYALDARGKPAFDAKLTMLAGRYRAQNDLLLVTWSDGSRTNYRWRREGADLFLTDHTGRTSQLRRIYQ